VLTLASFIISHAPTPQQNRVAERKHRHLVQCTLTLLSQSGLSLSYWSYALAIATHLINKLPTPLLNMSSPWEQLHTIKPDISYLKTFGCKCFPSLSPYNTHKLQPKTTPCIFLGYPPTTKGYLCQDPITKKLFISRHVLFNETEFPALEIPIPSQSSATKSYSSDSWFTHLLSTHTCTSLSCSPCPNSTSYIAIDQALAPPSLTEPSTAPILTSDIQPTAGIQSLGHAFAVDSFHNQPPVILAPPIPHISPTISNSHPMQTRSKHGIFKPKTCYKAQLDCTLTEPPTFKIATQISQWC
jgi:hypothetical protein